MDFYEYFDIFKLDLVFEIRCNFSYFCKAFYKKIMEIFFK